MKQSLPLWQFAGFGFASLLGTILHFLYDWTGQNTVAALFSGVNESTWEHMKLLFFPMFLFAVIQSRDFKKYRNFWYIKLIGIAVGLILIPVLFYTFNGVFGQSPDWINIVIFFVSAALVYLLEYYLFKTNRITCRFPQAAFVAICLIGASFIVFTFLTPEIPLFLDPLTGTYGIQT